MNARLPFAAAQAAYDAREPAQPDESLDSRTDELIENAVREYDGTFRDWLLFLAKHEPLRLADAVAAACRAHITFDEQAGLDAGEIIDDLLERFSEANRDHFAERAIELMAEER
jgi:hypothetical protein